MLDDELRIAMKEVGSARSEMFKAAKKSFKKLLGSLGISNSSITKSTPGYNIITPKQDYSVQECQICTVRKNQKNYPQKNYPNKCNRDKRYYNNHNDRNKSKFKQSSLDVTVYLYSVILLFNDLFWTKLCLSA